MSDEDTKAADHQAENGDENLDSKKQDGDETQKAADTQAVEGGDKKAKDDVKKEENPYKKQLDDLNADLEKKDDIIGKKNRALESEKKARKEAEQALEDKEDKVDQDKSLSKKEREDIKAELRDEFKAERQKEKFEDALESHTDDEVKKELVRKIYDNRIVKTGNIKEDLANALAIADRNVNAAALERMAQQERDENDMSFYQSSDVRSETETRDQNSVNKVAAQILRNAGEEKAIKKLK